MNHISVEKKKDKEQEWVIHEIEIKQIYENIFQVFGSN